MTTSPTDQTDRAGIHAVGAIFTRLKWIFREQPTSDYGIDAQAEKLNADGTAGGKLIALQIKTGTSYFRRRGDGYVYYGEERHREYWVNHSLQVFLILHDPQSGLTLWQRIERHLIEEGKDGRWAIPIPADQTLDEAHEHFIAAGIASDLSSIKRARLALDIPLIRDFAEYGEGFMRIQDWVNKTLNFRYPAIIVGDDPDGEVWKKFDFGAPTYTVEYFMAFFFPWLDWKLHEYIDAENYYNEIAEHVLAIKLSEVGRSILTLEEFYNSGLPTFYPEDTDVEP